MKVLLSRTDKLGDLVLSIPLATALKTHDKNTYVAFLVREYQAPLLAHHPDIDEVLILGRIKILDIKKFDTFIDVFPRFKTAFMAFRARIKTRIGTAYRLWSILYNRPVKFHRRPSVLHEYIYNFKLLEPLGKFEPVKPRLYLTRKEILKAQKILSGLKKPLVALHPSEGGSAPDVEIGVYKKISEFLKSRGASVIHIGQTKSPELETNLDLGGETDLRTLMAILHEIDLLICPSTGPMHIANALGTPTISFFKGTGASRPSRWGPLYEKSRVIIGDFDEKEKTLHVDLDKVLEGIKEFLM